MNIKKFRDDVILPKKKYNTDGGFDCYIPDAFQIAPLETICIGLGFGVEVPKGYATMFIPRSSTTKKGLICQTSIVDNGYQGEVHLIITNCSNTVYSFEKNDRLVSMITYKYLDEELVEIDEFKEDSERKDNGLGSTGK